MYPALPNKMSQQYNGHGHTARNNKYSISAKMYLKALLASIRLCRKNPFEVWELAFLSGVKGGSLLLVLPFSINKDATFVLPCGVLKNIAWHTLLLFYWIDICYLASVAKHVTLSRFPETEYVNFYVHLLSRLLAGVLAIIVAADKKRMKSFINVLVHTQRKFKGIKILSTHNVA